MTSVRPALEEPIPEAPSPRQTVDFEVAVDGGHEVDAAPFAERGQRGVGEIGRQVAAILDDPDAARQVGRGRSVDLDVVEQPAEGGGEVAVAGAEHRRRFADDQQIGDERRPLRAARRALAAAWRRSERLNREISGPASTAMSGIEALADAGIVRGGEVGLVGRRDPIQRAVERRETRSERRSGVEPPCDRAPHEFGQRLAVARQTGLQPGVRFLVESDRDGGHEAMMGMLDVLHKHDTGWRQPPTARAGEVIE